MQGICTRPLSTVTALGAAFFVTSALTAQTDSTASHIAPNVQGQAGETSFFIQDVTGAYREENGAILGACGTPITQNNDPDTITGGQVACGAAGSHTTENGWARSFAAGTFSTGICQVRFGVQQNTDIPWTIDVNIYSGNINGPFGALTLLGTKTVTIDPVPEGELGGFYVANFFPEVTIPAGSAAVIELFAPTRSPADGGPGGFTRTAVNNVAGATGPAYLRSASCGFPDFVDAATIGFPDAQTIIVAYNGQGQPPVGACCLGEGADECEILDEAACNAQGGNWLGEAAPCANCPTTVVCEAPTDCPQDLNSDNVVDIFDLLALLGAWGPCPGCPADLTGDNVVDIFDLLNLLGAWGPCAAGGSNVVIEPENCGDDVNGGCNDPGDATTPLQLGDTVCGTAWAEKGTRDTDWYEVTVNADTELTWSVHAEFPALAFILTDDCENLLGLATATSPAGVPFEISVCVQPGTYRLFVADEGFEGNPCGSGSNDYVATVSGGACVFTSACCFDDGTCADLTPAECAAGEGTFNDFFTCEETLCLPAPVDCPQGDTDEGEPCVDGSVDVVNGGCNSDPEVFGQICCDESVTGTIWADGGTRDLDWYILTIDQAQFVSWTVEHNFGGAPLDGIAFIATAECPTTIIQATTSPSPTTASALLAPGQYFLVVTASDFDGMPCAFGGSYTATVTCLPDDICLNKEVGCGGFFFDPKTGFFCSCEDGCLDFGECCPGVCTSCPDQDQCAPLAACSYDTGVTTNAIGFGAGTPAALVWLHKCVGSGLTQVNEILTSYGFPGGTSGVVAGDPVGVAIHAVAANGSPGALLFSTTTTVDGAAIESNQVQSITFPAVNVPSEYFISAWVAVPGGFPAPLDENPGDIGDLSWIAGETNIGFGDVNPNNLGALGLPPATLTSVGFPGAWLLRANGN